MTVSLGKRWTLFFAITFMALRGSEAGGPLNAFAMEPGKKEPVLPAATDSPSSATAEPSAHVPSSNPMSGQPEAVEAGRKLYFMWCVQCHGPKADGVSRFGQYAADLRKFWRGYREFVTIVTKGRPERQMPPWKEVLDEPKISQVGAYLETLAIEDANWR